MARTTLLMFLALLAAGAEASTAPPVVSAATIELARVNGEVITDADVKAAFVGKHGGHTVFLGGDTEIRRFLDIVINERLLVQEAYNLGLDSDPEVKPAVDQLRARLAAEQLIDREIAAKSKPSREEIQAAWELADELFFAREIVVDTKSEAEQIRTALLGGADFDSMARACSIAPSKTRGGGLPPFTWGSLSLELENVAFALAPGEISEPFHTRDGWVLLYLHDRGEATRPALDEKISDRIAVKLTERKKAALTDALATSLWRKYEAKLLLEELTPTALIRLVRNAPDTMVATWQGGGLTAKESLTEGELRMYATFAPGRAEEKVRETVEAAVSTALIRLEARSQKLDELPSVVEAVERHEAKLMESVLYARHVLTDVKVADSEVREAYEKQKANLVLPEKRRVAHMAVATEAEARTLLERIRKGADFAELLKVHTLDKPSVKQGGDIGWIEKGKVAETYDSLFGLAVGGVGEPIKSENAWHLVRVTAIEPEQPLSFDDAKDRVRKTLLEKKKHDAREFWIQKLREASEIEVLDPGITAFVAANPYEDPPK